MDFEGTLTGTEGLRRSRVEFAPRSLEAPSIRKVPLAAHHWRPRGAITNRRPVEQPEGAELGSRATIKTALSTPSSKSTATSTSESAPTK